MKPEHRSILLECLRREREIAARPEPRPWFEWEVQAHEDDVLFGPKYRFGEWFGDHPNRVRQAYLRAVYELGGEPGLLELTRSGGGRLERVRLTDEGRVVAEQLGAAECEV